MNVGPAEILVILAVALIVFGPKRLPEIGRQVGAVVRELRRIQDTVKSELDTVINPDVPPSGAAAALPPTDDAAGPAPTGEPDHTTVPPMPAPDPEEGFRGPSSFS